MRASTLNAGTLLASIARTNVQLYNQLLGQGRSRSDLELVKRAYDLAAQLYAGAYQADGKPFVVHVVSVASTVALLGQPSRFVAAALVHNVYNNGDFGDGKHRDYGARRRRVLRTALGGEVEELVRRFAELRIDRNLDGLLARCDSMTEADRNLVVMDLADLLEKHLDRGVLYFGQGYWVTEFSFQHVEELRRLATALGEPVLGQALAEAIGSARDSVVPGALRSDPARKYLGFIAPLSYRKRWPVVLQQRIYRPLRTRLGRLKRRLA